LDGKYLKSEDSLVYNTISRLKEASEGVIEINEEHLKNEILHVFIQQIRNYFMGDLIDVSLSQGKPIQFTPVLNIQTDIRRIQATPERSVGEDIMLNLNEIIFFIENPSSFPNKFYPSNIPFEWEEPASIQFKYIDTVISQIPHSISENLLISIVTKDFARLQNKETLISTLNNSNIKKKIHLYYKNEISELIFNINELSLTLNVDFPFDKQKFEKTKSQLKAKIKTEELNVIFFIAFPMDMDEAEKIIGEYNIREYTFVPFYIGSNLNFFRENVYLDEEDLFTEPVSMKNIFLHQSLNIESFGKLYIFSNGNVYSNLFSERLGFLPQKTLLQLLYKEFNSSGTWFKTRNYTPCNSCHLQWLCPPPSIYELLLGKNNLCHVCS
jgi:pseudo-rSAM protein